jgi:two-component system response regulator AtoC
VEQKLVREDLYFRLSVLPIEIPPLRRRRRDIPLLADAFVQRLSRDLGRKELRLTDEAKRVLCEQPWPGNVRELQNLIERIVLLEDGPELEVRHLPEEMRRPSHPLAPGNGAPAASGDQAGLLDALARRWADGAQHGLPSLREVEDVYIGLVLEHCGGNRSEAARRLRLSRQGLLDRLRRIREEHPQAPEVKPILPAGGRELSMGD